MYAELIRGFTDLSIQSLTGLGGTRICFEALVAGRIDCYPEYTGTALLAILHLTGTGEQRLASNRDSVYQYVRRQFESRYGLEWLSPIGFNNAYALMMRRRQAQELGIHSISDLADYIKKDK